MHHPLEITADYNYFYLKDQKFFPMIQEQDFEFESLEAANSVLITIPARSDDELIWEEQRSSAEKAVEQGKLIIWEMDFGLKSSQILLHESSIFYSFGIALEEFVNTLWRDFKHHTLGVVLYRGDVDFSKRFIWTEQQREFFIEKIRHLPLYQEALEQNKHNIDEWILTRDGQYLFQLFCADVFAEYFHRLVAYLPETVLAFCLLDASEVTSSGFLAQLLSKERFQHILLGLKKSQVPAGHLNWEEGACLGGWMGQSYPYFSTVSDISIGVCLPPDELLDLDALANLDLIFAELNQLRIPYRIIPESFLTEAWDGLNDIVVLSSAVTAQGKRKLLGFCAAGGRVICLGDSLGLVQELPFNEFRKNFSSSEILI